MNMQMLAQNVRRIRNAKKMSQSDLAEEAGLSLPAIKNLELSKGEPRMSTMQAIAKTLEVSLQELFSPVRELNSVRFRSAKRMQNRENVLALVSRWLNDFNYLEEIMNDRIPFSLSVERKECFRERIIEAANHCRKKLKLKPNEPIYNICGLLENAGVKVLTVPMASDGFFGMSVGEEDGGPAVIVNVWDRISVERQIFSAAHELGHLMLHPFAYDVAKIDETEEEEREANCFAGHFLMPDEGFMKEWNESAGLNFVDRVFKIKRIFRVSYKTVLARFLEKKAVDNSIWQKFNVAFQQRFGQKLNFKEEPHAVAEPVGMKKYDFSEDRFKRLAREAVEKEKISISRGSEILGVGIEEFRELLQDLEVKL